MPDVNNKREEKDMEKALSVSDFLESMNASLLKHAGRVQGEVTSIKTDHPSTIFFTIKDPKNEALLRCIIWQTTYKQNGISVKVGDEIIVTGKPEVFPRNGNFSFKTQTIEYAGEGALKKAYEELKEKFAKEGLFELERKRPLPDFPQKIGVITSKSGVVLQDLMTKLGKYGFKVIFIDSRVEGKDAIHDILASIKAMEKEDIEVLVIMRGGGSWEALQPFNTESVVRALAGFKYPVLTGIGHDVDVTLAQMVADIGESTPTAVAEALNEPWDNLISSIDFAESNIFRKYSTLLHKTERRLSQQSSKIYSFFTSLERKISKAKSAIQQTVGELKAGIRAKHDLLGRISRSIVKDLSSRIQKVDGLITDGMATVLAVQKDAIKTTKRQLSDAERNIAFVDPRQNLKRGYSLSYVEGKLIRSVSEIKKSDVAETHLSDGKFTSEIRDVE